MKVLKTFEFSTRTQSKRDWSTLLDGQIRQLDPSDFDGAKPDTITTQARTQGRKRGKVVRIAKNEDGSIVIQAVDATPDQKKAWADADATKKAEKKAAKEAAKKGEKETAETPPVPATPPAAKATVGTPASTPKKK